MSRYISATDPEAEYEPGSRGRVLRNHLGITRKRDIDQLEFESLIRVQEQYYSEIEDSTSFTTNSSEECIKIGLEIFTIGLESIEL